MSSIQGVMLDGNVLSPRLLTMSAPAPPPWSRGKGLCMTLCYAPRKCGTARRLRWLVNSAIQYYIPELLSKTLELLALILFLLHFGLLWISGLFLWMTGEILFLISGCSLLCTLFLLWKFLVLGNISQFSTLSKAQLVSFPLFMHQHWLLEDVNYGVNYLTFAPVHLVLLPKASELSSKGTR